MGQIVNLGDGDSYALNLGRLILQGFAAATNNDISAAKLDQLQKELDDLKEQVDALLGKGDESQS